MSFTAIVREAQQWGTVLFGIGFLAPLIAQTLDAIQMTAPFGLTDLTFGLVLGLALGGVAKLRGRWL